MKLTQTSWLKLPLAAAVACMTMLCALPTPAHADPKNEDEWYDPTDWFDGNNVESDDTWGPYEDYSFRDYDYTPYTSYRYSTYPYYYDWDTTNGWRDTYYTDDNDYDWSDTYNDNRNTKPLQLSGYVDGFRDVNVRNRQGQSGKFTIVRLRLKSGKSALVDIGQFKSLNSLELKKGKYVSVRGNHQTINGRDVILASQINSDGKTSFITRLDQNRTENRSSFSKDQQGEQTFQGTVESYKKVNVEGEPAGHTLVKIRTDNDRSMIIDLGPTKTPQSLGISKDDHVTIRVNKSQLNGKSILNARSVTVNGTRNKISQSDSSTSR